MQNNVFNEVKKVLPWSSLQYDKNLKYISTSSQPNYLYLYNKNTKEQLTLKLVPDSVSENYKARILSESPFGTLKPYYFYGGGENKTIGFSFEVHEDIVEKADFHNANDLYSLVDLIKNMSKPTILNGIIQEPLVYMQLGNHFAGTGHITASFEYKKPYSVKTGTYKIVACNLTFVYHETFENIEYNFDSELKKIYTIDYDDSIVKLTNSLLQTNNKNMSVDDFLSSTLDYDYIVSSIFSNEKIKKVFNIVSYSINTSVINTSVQVESQALEELRTNVKTYNVLDVNLLKQVAPNLAMNPFAAGLYNLYIRYLDIMSPLASTTTTSLMVNKSPHLKTLLEDISKARTRFMLSGYVFKIAEIEKLVVDYDIQYVLGAQTRGRPDMSSTKHNLDLLKSIIGDQYITAVISGLEKYYEDFIIANNDSLSNAEEKLNILKTKVRETYNNNAYGWYQEETRYIYNFYNDLTTAHFRYQYTNKEDSEAIMSSYDYLTKLIVSQINVYDILYGAGS